MSENSMIIGVSITVGIFMAGVIYQLGRASERLDQHERRLNVLEATIGRIDASLVELVTLFRNGGPE